MAEVVLITGSNMGDRNGMLRNAECLLEMTVGKILKRSSVTESGPWGNVEGGEDGKEAGAFLNQVLVLETTLTPERLLIAVNDIEKKLGRIRGGGARPVETGCGTGFAGEAGNPRDGEGYARKTYESRFIDIDILFYGDAIVDTPELKIPHPLITERGFVLNPLAETVPEYVHPVFGKTVGHLFEEYNEKEA